MFGLILDLGYWRTTTQMVSPVIVVCSENQVYANIDSTTRMGQGGRDFAVV